MIELRWLVKPHTTTKPPVLQCRVLLWRIDAGGAVNVMPPEWGPWQDVPRVEAEKSDDA